MAGAQTQLDRTGAPPAADPLSAAVRWEAAGAGGGTLVLSGSWTLRSATPGVASLARTAQPAAEAGPIRFDTAGLTGWDSTFVAAVLDLMAAAGSRPVDLSGLPQGVQRLVALDTAVPERQGARRTTA